jgi:hypothetical protein
MSGMKEEIRKTSTVKYLIIAASEIRDAMYFLVLKKSRSSKRFSLLCCIRLIDFDEQFCLVLFFTSP